MPRSQEEKGETAVPSTLERSDKHAQEIYKKAHDAALEQYGGEEARAHRVAFAAVRREYEKQGDRWVRKPEGGTTGPRSTRSSSMPQGRSPGQPRSRAGGSRMTTGRRGGRR